MWVEYTCRDVERFESEIDAAGALDSSLSRSRAGGELRVSHPAVGARVIRSGMELQVVINEAESSLLPIGEETPGIPAEF